MEDIGLLKQCWQWFRSQKDAGWRARNAVTWCRDRTGVFIDRHWPMVCRGCSRLGSLLRLSVIFWKDSALRGFQSFIRFGPVMLLLIMWSCFLSLTSMYCLVYVLVSMVCLCFKLSKSPFLQFWVSDLCVYVCYPVIYFQGKLHPLLLRFNEITLVAPLFFDITLISLDLYNCI